MRHTNPTEFRIFECRYLFMGDSLIGRLDLPKGLFEFEPGMDVNKGTAFNFIAQNFGVPVREAKDIKPDPTLHLQPLPPEIAALKTPDLGFRTPAVRKWIAENRPKDYELIFFEKPPVETVAVTVAVGSGDPVATAPVAKKSTAKKVAAKKVATKTAPAAPVQPDAEPAQEAEAKPDVDDEPREIEVRTPIPALPPGDEEETMS